MCKSLGGDYDYDNQSCDIPMDDPKLPKSVLGKGLFPFFVLQLIAGTTSSVIVTFFRNVKFPSVWWTTYLILIIVCIIAFLMYWYKIGSVAESAMRTILSMLILYTFAIAFGWLYEWNIFIYWDPVSIASFPTTAVISGMGISALISFILIPPEKRKDETSINDFSGGATLSIFEST
jgi:hypothetical protein